MFHIKSVLSLFAFCITMHHVSAQKKIGDQDEINAIIRTSTIFSEHVMSSDYDAVANSYTHDAKIFPNNLDIISGRESIKQYWVLPDGVKTIHHKLIPEEIKIIGNEAYDYGRYEGTTLRKDDTEVSWRGKYVVIWRKEEEGWKMYLDIWNRIED